MGEVWYFIDSGNASPEWNMALDEKLVSWHSEGKIPPVIRFYGWNPATLSVGYFQKLKGKIDLEAVEKHGYGLVRRPTGGRAVLHDKELTYSVIVSEKHEAMPKTVTEAYRVISEGLLNGFRNLDIQADFSIPEGKLQQTGSAVCFEEPSWYELIVEGRKAAGSAQSRQKGVILQHGSIPIEVDDVALFDMFIYPNERVKERARKAFGGKAAAINEVAATPKSLEEVKSAFKQGFAAGLDIELEHYTLTEEQIEEVNELAINRYKSDEWTYYR
ncbi:octanoyltransferase [Pontibacillus halophilus JSM 076056 = DSM 19796]|uniref:Octanoyltransferase n=1 Tax=Pontibacillus halophilus JSM 076056 = DSM 19796 TaxID=1385510 RepID=A0A0A5I182_9BACI|nr:biotin/lipoate A/B protein ligase family protein [Pontibacillus halophilus]KGX89622.1 octanoyltransferase [Pontibacillus halophilus JSM 076056 = DSM 19796]